MTQKREATVTPLLLLSIDSVPTAAENPAAGQGGAEPEAEDSPRAVRAVCQGDDGKHSKLST